MNLKNYLNIFSIGLLVDKLILNLWNNNKQKIIYEANINIKVISCNNRIHDISWEKLIQNNRR